jgi:DNA-binding transcriptional LysR family regulator
MAGKGLNRIRAELLDPFAKHVLVHVQVTGSLCCRYPALPDQLYRLKLEFPTELSSLHGHLRLHETPKLGVHQTGSSSEIGFYTALAGLLRDAVFGFAREYPGVDVNLIEDNRTALIPLLDRGSIDIAVVLGDPAYRAYAHLDLWSERVMVVLPTTHPLTKRDFIYWTDLKDERFMLSLRDPGPEIQNILLGKISLPGERPIIDLIKVHHSLLISAVDDARGITLACEASSAPSWPGVVFREVRDGNGPTRLGFVAYWRRDNSNPTLKQFLTLLRTHPAVPTALI